MSLSMSLRISSSSSTQRGAHFLLNYTAGRRNFAVKTSWEELNRINLSAQKVQQLTPCFTKTIFPLSLSDTPVNAIRIIPTPASAFLNEASGPPAHIFCGGLPALMQAVRLLEGLGASGDETTQVIYINDGQHAKSLFSGHQAHNHSSEWSAAECQLLPLVKTFMRGIHILPEDNPFDLERYSYLHFPINRNNIWKNPGHSLRLYSKFFKQRIVHDLTSKNGLSIQDHGLCNNIEKSLNYHEEMNRKIEEQLGRSSFKRDFRIYWAPCRLKMIEKQSSWTHLGIKTEWISQRELIENTLLKTDGQLHVLKIFGDGKFFPETPNLIIQYLALHYPKQFIYKPHTAVEEIFVDALFGHSLVAYTRNLETGRGDLLKVLSLFGSPGHSEVYTCDVNKKIWQRSWEEVPVSGITSLWSCKISKEKIKARLGKEALSDGELRAWIDNIRAAANLSNFHLTVCGSSMDSTDVFLLCRATQGANFNATVASKQDLINMRNNIDAFLIGEWELISVGTCTRKTWVSNVPEICQLTHNMAFIHGLSGIGYSFSAAPLSLPQWDISKK